MEEANNKPNDSNILNENILDDNKYDLIIIGAGLSGFGAALYAGRFRLKTLVIGKESGGVINSAKHVDNYPGIPAAMGMDLADMVKDHAMNFGSKLIIDNVNRLEKDDDGFVVYADSTKYHAGALIIATGSQHKNLGIPGERELKGNGVHSCAMCDGWLYKGKTVAVVGGSDSAVKEAMVLSENADKVFIIYRGSELRAEPIILERLQASDKIEVIYEMNVIKAQGEGKLSSVVLDKEYNGSTELKVDGLFVDIGYAPVSQLSAMIGVELNERQEVITDKFQKTNVDGIFAAGDVTDMPFKQAITGVGQGVTASYSAYMYIKQKKTKK